MSICFRKRAYAEDEQASGLPREMMVEINEVSESAIRFSYPALMPNANGEVNRKDLLISLRGYFRPNTYRRIFVDVFGKPIAVDMSVILNARGSNHSIISAYEGIPTDWRRIVISVSYGATVDDCHAVVDGEFLSNVELDVHPAVHATQALIERVGDKHTWLPAFMKTWKAKRSLLAEIEPLESLSSLEKQVDLLTEMVLALATSSDTEGVEVLKRYLENKSYETHSDHDESIAIKKRLRETISQYKSKK
jgi:hypothetical protein